MRIKKLDIFGFKSFATRQTITFGNGTTGIVGPNGCGKSNVVDALKWVMGEQNARQLRGGQMQDIIFCGSDKKSPLGFAEVILTLENDSTNQNVPLDYQHFTEIQIARRLYKTGESDFEINKQKVRLRDIQEFFLGTGIGAKAYSIIEQGRVNQVISAKAIEKRAIIEEAAGITKYKAKKNAAEKRIESTKINLSRIVDIHKEVEKRVNSLAKEKEKLDAVVGLKERIKEIDLHLSTHKYLGLTAEKQFLCKEIMLINEKIANLKRDFAFDEQTFEKILKEYIGQKDEKDLLEKLTTQHQSSLELTYKDKTYAEQTLNDNKTLVQRLNGQISDIENRVLEINKEIAELELGKQESLASLEHITKMWEEVNEKRQAIAENRKKFLEGLENVQNSLVQKASMAAKLQGEILAIKSQEKQRQIQLKSLQEEEEQIKKDISEHNENLLKLKSELESGKKKSEELTAFLKSKEENISLYKDNERKLLTEISTLQKEIIKLSSRYQSLDEIHKQLKWSQSGTVKLLASEQKNRILGVLADAIEVKAGYETIVEKTFSHVLDSAILKSKDDLLQISDYLKENKCANTSFFCLDKIAQRSDCSLAGATNLFDFITIKHEHYQVLKSYLSSFYLVEDLSIALSLWSDAQDKKLNLITKNYELLLCDKRAIFIGEKDDKGILKRKSELESLHAELESLANQEKVLTANEEENKKILDNLVAQKEAIISELKPLDFGLVRLVESVKQKEIMLANFNNQLSKINLRLVQLSGDSKNKDEEILTLEKSWANALADHKKIEEQVLELKKERANIEEIYEEQASNVKKIEIEKTSLKEKINNIEYSSVQAQKNIAHLAEQKKSFGEQLKEKNDEELILEEKSRQAAKKIEKVKAELRSTESLFIMADEKCKNLFEQKKRAELTLGDIKNALLKEQEKLHKKDLELNTSENNITSLLDRVHERYELDLKFYIADFHDKPINEKEAGKTYLALKQDLQSMGLVNENAEKEYFEYKKRCDFLAAQIQDLSSALEHLEGAIEKINKTTCLRFIEAFNSINNQFSKVFARLFGGGKAELVLTNSEDLLNSGVDILARPPGKNINSIELMSGGEKALTAISLIIAIFLIKPSPFCLLDEVDAPLDEANVSRFNSLIREISEICQVILITHNRKTMESADRLFGVTMQDAGCSKIVYADIKSAFDATKSPNQQVTEYKKPTQLFLSTD